MCVSMADIMPTPPPSRLAHTLAAAFGFGRRWLIMIMTMSWQTCVCRRDSNAKANKGLECYSNGKEAKQDRRIKIAAHVDVRALASGTRQGQRRSGEVAALGQVCCTCKQHRG